MSSIASMSPFDCRMWEIHHRLDASLSEESCRAEIESFQRHGQMLPVLGRPLPPTDTHKVELVYGSRRLFVARHINVPLLVELREMTDREAMIAMDMENRQRTDLSPYERGMSYARALREGCFRSQEDIAQTLRISKSQVSRLIKLTQLPSVVMNAFETPAAIHETWGLELMRRLECAEARAAVVRVARRIGEASPRPPAQDVYRALVNPAEAARLIERRTLRDEIVKGGDGRPLIRIRRNRNSIAFLVSSDKVPSTVLERLKSAMVDVLGDRFSLEATPVASGQGLPPRATFPAAVTHGIPHPRNTFPAAREQRGPANAR